MLRLNGKRRGLVRVSKDQKKESIIRELGKILANLGYSVRRERLKQGQGWKVLSGSCTFMCDRLIFIDSRMSQDDQIGFLVAKLARLDVPLSPQQLSALPVRLQVQLGAAA